MVFICSPPGNSSKFADELPPLKTRPDQVWPFSHVLITKKVTPIPNVCRQRRTRSLLRHQLCSRQRPGVRQPSGAFPRPSDPLKTDPTSSRHGQEGGAST